ncbi:MAG: polysaccharide biosynthesis tyrosine autokinase, partial [Chitinophagaceae bacterium]
LENVNNQRRALSAGKQDLAGTNSKYTALLGSIPQKERELLEISRQQSIKNNIYTFLLQKREETALSYASTVPDSRLIDVAETADTPVNPKPKMVYLMAILGALAAGILGISIREAINNNIVSRTEIEKYTAAPILGEIVNDNSKRAIVIAEGVRSYIAEQFRQLRTSLGYLGINNRKKRVLVTSTISGEGKSFVSSNLGVSLALMGKKVVMLELDLRKPKLSDQFEMRRDIGITNYLIGAKAIDQIQFKVPNIPNLTLIPSGPIPPNPSELIMGEKMIELLNELDKEFDYIIIDTAPVSPVTDAYILSPLCDATLYVVRYGVTPKSYIQKMDEQNRIRELKNRAIIFNGVKDRGFTKNTYGYGYAYVTEAEEKGKGNLFTKKKKANV